MPVIKADKLIHHGWGKFHVLTVEGDERGPLPVSWTPR